MCHWWAAFIVRRLCFSVPIHPKRCKRYRRALRPRECARAFLIRSRIQAEVETISKKSIRIDGTDHKNDPTFSRLQFSCVRSASADLFARSLFSHTTSKREFMHHMKIHPKCGEHKKSMANVNKSHVVWPIVSLVTHSVDDHLNYNNRVCSIFVNEQNRQKNEQRKKEQKRSNAAHKSSENEERARCSYQRDNWQRVS